MRAAHRFAMASDHITADMIEGSEFPHLVVRYNVGSVPHTVINEEHGFTGALSEQETLREIRKAIGKTTAGDD
ncbi:MAG: thioredoxin family protein [Deltaproteobacteria bacterium]|nr:thioredoxin family protein [Deltaproteobacteria bacterium]